MKYAGTQVFRMAALFALAAGLLAAACSPSASPGNSDSDGGGNEQAASQLKIAARDNVFDPKSPSVSAGKPVNITFVNEGNNVHEVEIKGLVSETTLQPGESKSFTVTPEKKSYKMYCEIHEDQGMVGEFTGE